MSDPLTTTNRVDAILQTTPTTTEAVELTRAMVQRHALSDAALILAELGIEES